MSDRPGTPARAFLLTACLLGTAGLNGCSPRTATPTDRGLLFRSSGNPVTFVNVVDTQSNVTGYNGSGAPELSPGTLPGDWGVYTIPTHSGVNVIRFAGSASGDARCAMKAYSTHLLIDSSTKLSYWLFPQQDNARYVGVDLHCTDGTTLSGSGAQDDQGQSMDPSSGHGDSLTPRTWTQVQCDIGKWLAGKTVDQISVLYHRQEGGGQYRGYIDDIAISDSPILSRSAIVTAVRPQTPTWVKSAVIYGINPRQFSPQGTLSAIVPQLDRIHKLGATVLWLLPINPVGQEKAFGSPYCVRDYTSINPAYGKDADLHRLVDTAHSRGMKIILDLALDHTSWDNPLITQHPDWYRHTDSDVKNPATVSRTPMWSDVVQLDYSNPALRTYMIEMEKRWLTTFNLDGFRYDSAELVPTEFWNESTDALKSVKPDILLLGEAHRPETMMKAFNVDYAFTLYPQLMSVMQGHDTVSSLGSILEYERFQFPAGTRHMRYAGNQDTDKPMATFGTQGALAATLLTFTLDGVPLIYNGQEIGDSASGNFISAPPIDWAKGKPGISSFFAQLAALRRQYPELVDGDTKWSGTSSQKVAGYVRSNGTETVAVAINMSGAPAKASLGFKPGLKVIDVTPSTSTAGLPTPKSIAAPVSDVLPPFGFKVYACQGGIGQVLANAGR